MHKKKLIVNLLKYLKLRYTLTMDNHEEINKKKGKTGFAPFKSRRSRPESDDEIQDDSDDESLTRQVLNMVLENNAVFPYLTGWLVFNVIILILLIYIWKQVLFWVLFL